MAALPLRLRRTSTVSRPSGSTCSGANGTFRVPAATAAVYQEDCFQVSSRQALAGGLVARRGPSGSLAKRPPKATPTDPHKARVTGDRQSTRPTTYRIASPSHGQRSRRPPARLYTTKINCKYYDLREICRNQVEMNCWHAFTIFAPARSPHENGSTVQPG